MTYMDMHLGPGTSYNPDHCRPVIQHPCYDTISQVIFGYLIISYSLFLNELYQSILTTCYSWFSHMLHIRKVGIGVNTLKQRAYKHRACTSYTIFRSSGKDTF